MTDGAVRTLRLGALGLAGLSTVATGYELAAERHWGSALQLVAWAALGVLVVAIALAAVALRAGGGPVVPLVRVLAGVALLASAFGVLEHVTANHMVGALTYSDSWDSRSGVGRWLLAATKSVGAAPPLAPGALGQSALLVLLTTVGLRRQPGAEQAGGPRTRAR